MKKQEPHNHLNRHRKAFGKIQHLVMKNTVNKLGIEGNSLT